jgi:hypothetical protein
LIAIELAELHVGIFSDNEDLGGIGLAGDNSRPASSSFSMDRVPSSSDNALAGNGKDDWTGIHSESTIEKQAAADFVICGDTIADLGGLFLSVELFSISFVVFDVVERPAAWHTAVDDGSNAFNTSEAEDGTVSSTFFDSNVGCLSVLVVEVFVVGASDEEDLISVVLTLEVITIDSGRMLVSAVVEIWRSAGTN